MGQRADKVTADLAHQAPLYFWANLAIAAASTLDYLVGPPWALEALVIFVVLINGFALWQWRSALAGARARDLEDEAQLARSEAARDARLRSHGIR
jgi:hypothetical protein